MKQIKKYLILAFYAILVSYASVLFWTAVITGFAPLEADLVSIKPSQILIEEDAEEHSSAPEEKTSVPKADLPSEIPAIAPSDTEKKSADTGIVEKIFRSLVQRELEQWGINEWFSISIPSIGVRAPVLLPDRRYWDAKKWDLLEEQMQIALLNGTAAYPHSVRPGYLGSLIITGHSSPPDERAKESPYGRIFSRLPELKHDDKITIAWQGNVMTYRVVRISIVEPTDTEILAQGGDRPYLKLITCYPIGTTKQRIVITAVKE